MSQHTVSRVALPLLTAVILCISPAGAWAKRGGGSRGGGGSHGGGFHGGGSRGGGGHSSFFGGGHSDSRGDGRRGLFGRGNFFGGSRGKPPSSSNVRMGRGGNNNFRMSSGPYGRQGNFSARSNGNFGNFSRNANFDGGRLSSRGSANKFAPSRFSQPPMQNFRNGGMGGWGSGRGAISHSTPGSIRPWANSPRGGWQSFGNSNRGEGMWMARSYENDARTVRNDGQWHSFGNGGNWGNNRGVSYRAGFSGYGDRESALGTNVAREEFRRNRFSDSSLRRAGFSQFPSERSYGRFSGGRLGQADLASFGFENSFSGSNFGNSFIGNSLTGSGVSLLPNLLGGLLNFGTLGTSLLGGGLLGSPAISLATNLVGTGLNAIGLGQNNFNGGFGGGRAELYGGGPQWGISVQSTPSLPPCGGLMYPPPYPGRYCAPYSGYSYGWSGTVNFGDSGNNLNPAYNDSHNPGDYGNGN